MEETTTDAATQDTGVTTDVTQPDEQPAEAVTTADSEPTQTTESEDTEEPAPADNSEDLADYWLKKGIDISTPEGQLAAAKSYREAEQALSRKAQEASELKKSLVDQPVTVDTEDPLTQQLAEKVVTMERQQQIDKFMGEAKLTSEQEGQFAEFIENTPNMATLINGGYLTLNQAYKLSGVGAVDPGTYKKQGEKEALQTLANKQVATAPRGNASTGTPKKGDPILDILRSDD